MHVDIFNAMYPTNKIIKQVTNISITLLVTLSVSELDRKITLIIKAGLIVSV